MSAGAYLHDPVSVETHGLMTGTWVLKFKDAHGNDVAIFTTQARAEAMARAFQEAKE